MNFKFLQSRLTVLGFFLTGISLLMSGCGGNNPPPITPIVLQGSNELPIEITLYTTRDLISPEVMGQYEDATDITVIARTYENEQVVLNNLLAQPGKYTVLLVSNYMASVLKGRGLLVNLDPANIPNMGNIDIRFRNLDYDRSNQFCAPIMWGGVGIGYINGQTPTPTSWRELVQPAAGSPAYGRISLLDNPREALGAALLALGHDPNTTIETEIQEAKNLILQSAGGIAALDNTNYANRLVLGEAMLVQGWNKDMLSAQENNVEANLAFPQEGGLLRIYSLCIPASITPGEKRAVESFINIALQTDAAGNSVFWSQHATTVSDAKISQDTKDNPLIYIPENIYRDMHYVQWVGPLEIIYENAWAEIKARFP